MDFNIQTSHCQRNMVEGVESWISCQQLRSLKKASHWQTNSAPSKGQTKSKWFFQTDVSSKNRTNEFDFTTMILQVDLFSFVFWKKLKTPKRHFEINRPLEKKKILFFKRPIQLKVVWSYDDLLWFVNWFKIAGSKYFWRCVEISSYLKKKQRKKWLWPTENNKNNDLK